MMVKQRLGNSDLEITPLGFGTYALGGARWKFAWGPQDDDASVATIRHAVTNGINWIDTAAVYGHGHAEEIVRRAVEGLANPPLIFTKCSMVWNESGELTNVLKRDSIRAEVEQSLRRLGVDVIDLYQIHWARAEADLEEAWETLAELKQQGKVRYIGVSNFNVEQMKRAEKIAPITSLQPPYSMLNRDIEAEILPYAKQRGIGVIAYSPLQNGLLTGKMTKERVASLPENDWRRGSSYFQEPELSKNLGVAGVLGDIAGDLTSNRRPYTAAEVAIAWVLLRPGVTGAIVGARSPEQLDELLYAADIMLDAQANERIDAALSG